MASLPSQGPVTDEDFRQAKEQLKNLDLADSEILKAERAGIDMTEQKKQSRESRVKIQQFLQTYFPGK